MIDTIIYYCHATLYNLHNELLIVIETWHLYIIIVLNELHNSEVHRCYDILL